MHVSIGLTSKKKVCVLSGHFRPKNINKYTKKTDCYMYVSVCQGIDQIGTAFHGPLGCTELLYKHLDTSLSARFN